MIFGAFECPLSAESHGGRLAFTKARLCALSGRDTEFWTAFERALAAPDGEFWALESLTSEELSRLHTDPRFLRGVTALLGEQLTERVLEAFRRRPRNH